jgi:aryl-alcohol dehydrogenase-like predicted oxidoreductase
MSDSLKNPETLPTVALGRTGMKITRTGFGSWALGGGDWAVGWGDQDDAASIAAIRHAVARGVNWIDTAAIYGLGRAEAVVAQALRDIPKSERPYVFSKCGMIADAKNPGEMPRRIGAPASIRREVEGSLRRLGVERIDLYQMHWPANDGTPLEDYWQTLLDLKKEGKIRAAGLSNHSVAQLEAAERLGHVDTLQPPFSAIKRAAGNAEIAWCAAHGTGVIVYSPMQAGLLTGAFSAQRVRALPKNDWRSRNVEFSEHLEANLHVAAALARVAHRHNVSTAAAAVAWTLAWPGVTAAIVGARNAAQVDGWIGAATCALTPEDMCEVAKAITYSRAGSGAALPDEEHKQAA